jgi:hypothetical protein
MAGAALRLLLVTALAVCATLGASEQWIECDTKHPFPTRVWCLGLRHHPQTIWQPPDVPRTEVAENITFLAAFLVFSQAYAAWPMLLAARGLTVCLPLCTHVLVLLCLPGANAISIKDLPPHPEINCATSAVRSAFTACAFAGPTDVCCRGLDAVFANSSSISNW